MKTNVDQSIKTINPANIIPSQHHSMNLAQMSMTNYNQFPNKNKPPKNLESVTRFSHGPNLPSSDPFITPPISQGVSQMSHNTKNLINLDKRNTTVAAVHDEVIQSLLRRQGKVNNRIQDLQMN